MKTLLFALVLVPQSYEEATGKITAAAEKADTAPAKVAVGDDFSKLISKYPKKRIELLDAASLWYGKAWPDLDDVWKTKLKDRLARLYAGFPPAQERKFPCSGWGGMEGGKIDSLRVHSGSSALHFKLNRPAGGLADIGGTETFEVKPGKEAEFSAWGLADGNGLEDGCFIEIFDAAGKQLAQKGFVLKKDVPIWSRYAEKFPMPEGAYKAKLHVLLGSKTGDLWYDDFSLKVDGKEFLKNGGFEEK